MLTSIIVTTDAEYEAAVKVARDQGYKVAAVSNAGLPVGVRITFLPASAFQKGAPVTPAGRCGAPLSGQPQRSVDEFLNELPSEER